MRKINQDGIDLIKKFEGCELKAYKDSVGVLTIGFGHTGADVHEGQIISKDQAEKLLRDDLTKFEAGVEAITPPFLNSNQFSALVCFAFNVGLENLKNSSLLKYIKANELIKAAAEFPKWDKAGGKTLGGLMRRRSAEADLFNKPQSGILI